MRQCHEVDIEELDELLVQQPTMGGISSILRATTTACVSSNQRSRHLDGRKSTDLMQHRSETPALQLAQTSDERSRLLFARAASFMGRERDRSRSAHDPKPSTYEQWIMIGCVVASRMISRASLIRSSVTWRQVENVCSALRPR